LIHNNNAAFESFSGMFGNETSSNDLFLLMILNQKKLLC